MPRQDKLIRLLASALAALLLASSAGAAPGRPPAQPFSFFPIFYDTRSDADGERSAGVWPLYWQDRTEDSVRLGVPVLFSYYRDGKSGKSGGDILWPFFRHRREPTHYRFKDYRGWHAFPLFYSGSGTRDGVRQSATLLIPLYFSGTQGEDGRYLVVFPLVWYGRGIDMALIPRSKDEHFTAVLPFYGRFVGEKNDLRWVLWPLYVHSEKKKVEYPSTLTSIGWPFLALRGGPGVSGFRVWPLLSYAQRREVDPATGAEGAAMYRRAYFLWPFGHWRDGVVKEGKPQREKVRMLFPLFTWFEREKFRFFSVFPLYGSVRQEGRNTWGALLAAYTQDSDLRAGVRDHRLFWVLFRRRVPIEQLPDSAPELRRSASYGTAVFPFYWRFRSEERRSLIVAWPLYHQYWYDYPEYVYRRTWIPLLHSRRSREYKDGRRSGSQFFFPFFQTAWRETGERRSSTLHLWMLRNIDAVERNYSPLWTFWEREADPRTGYKRIRVMRGLYDGERTGADDARWRFNLLLFDVGGGKVDGKPAGRFGVLGGLYGRKAEPDGGTRTRLFWIKL
ncbi:MAG: hypothetical protein SF028_10575 [Candidatus Sumerlaeia bacterium]|nr:hypothetical protein [Candidatus Sumerlaeia bacterium]